MRAAGPQGGCVPPETAAMILADWQAAGVQAKAQLETRQAAAAALQRIVSGLDPVGALGGQAVQGSGQPPLRTQRHVRALAALWDRLAVLDMRTCKMLALEHRMLARRLKADELAP